MDDYAFSFENLIGWQKARVYTKEIYVLSRQFPKQEEYGLTAQIRRAAISICSNLAEGCGRNYPKDKARFTTIAYSSLLETINQATIAMDLGFLEEDQ